MAVQAQYPSSIPLLNRNGQEDEHYSSQLQPGGLLLNQADALVNNNAGAGTTNQRKRGRDISNGNSIVGSASPMNVYSLSMQPPQLIDLSQLHNNSVSAGLRLSFNNQQNHHQYQQQVQKINSPAILPLFKDDLTARARQQREAIDRFLQAQGEQMRHTLAEKRQKHYRALLVVAEESLARRLREKEAEVEKANRRNAELHSRAAQLGAEDQVWQAKARSQEAAAASLRSHLQQATTGGAYGNNHDRCGGGGESDGHAAEDAESVYVDPYRPSSSEPTCKACRRRAATVLMLPCRHLSVCRECERVAHACPLCYRAKSSSIEVYLP